MVYHSNNEFTASIQFIGLNLDLEVEGTEYGEVLSEQYLSFVSIVAISKIGYFIAFRWLQSIRLGNTLFLQSHFVLPRLIDR